jgi:hypothetical protein
VRLLCADIGVITQWPACPGRCPPVEITRTTEGTTWVVKVYHRVPVEASTLAQGLHDQLAQRYGLEGGFT